VKGKRPRTGDLEKKGEKKELKKKSHNQKCRPGNGRVVVGIKLTERKGGAAKREGLKRVRAD